jgi:hypothetical protein
VMHARANAFPEIDCPNRGDGRDPEVIVVSVAVEVVFTIAACFMGYETSIVLSY